MGYSNAVSFLQLRYRLLRAVCTALRSSGLPLHLPFHHFLLPFFLFHFPGMVDTNASAEESAVPAADASTATAAAAGNPNPASAAAKAGGEAGTSLGTVGTVSHLRVMRYRFCCIIACFVKCVPHFVHQGYPYTYLHHHFSFPFFPFSLSFFFN